jgi:folate-binding protein YgfZ
MPHQKRGAASADRTWIEPVTGAAYDGAMAAASTSTPSAAPPDYRSALLGLPGAVPAEDPDTGVAWHYGDPIAEQRAAARATGLVDLSHRDVLVVPGADRLTWLHTLTSQAVQDLADGATVDALILSPNGHVEHHLSITDLGGISYLDTEPGRGADLLSYLESMRFWSDVQPAKADLGLLALTGPSAVDTAGAAGLPRPEPGSAVTIAGGFVRSTPTGIEIAAPRTDLGDVAARLIAAGARPIGSWAVTALRIADRRPRLGVDTDERTIPHEVGWLQSAVHLDKGCYRGQETVARVHNLGRPPHRLVLLHLDGSVDTLPQPGDAVLTAEGRTVGRVGSVAHHHESGPIALALVKRAVAPGVPLLAGGVDAVMDPDDAVPEERPPTSAVDRRSLPDLRRR